jgi:hypothetical protein
MAAKAACVQALHAGQTGARAPLLVQAVYDAFADRPNAAPSRVGDGMSRV